MLNLKFLILMSLFSFSSFGARLLTESEYARHPYYDYCQHLPGKIFDGVVHAQFLKRATSVDVEYSNSYIRGKKLLENEGGYRYIYMNTRRSVAQFANADGEIYEAARFNGGRIFAFAYHNNPERIASLESMLEMGHSFMEGQLAGENENSYVSYALQGLNRCRISIPDIASRKLYHSANSLRIAKAQVMRVLRKYQRANHETMEGILSNLAEQVESAKRDAYDHLHISVKMNKDQWKLRYNLWTRKGDNLSAMYIGDQNLVEVNFDEAIESGNTNIHPNLAAIQAYLRELQRIFPISSEN
ncbi:hypothetical protein N9N67_09185 [Bacteriovoracaceae bacterium]|nr:hypothetical protein [Bacteriovoracaceae bacterium]